jgi:hypothetical protein
MGKRLRAVNSQGRGITTRALSLALCQMLEELKRQGVKADGYRFTHAVIVRTSAT